MNAHYDLPDLKVFYAVAQERNFSNGAARCNLSVSAVSLRIKNLEAAVGSSLLIRKPRGVELTQAGHILASHAKLCIDQLEHMHAELMPFGKGLAGQVTLFANNNAISSYLPQDLGRFFVKFPEVRVQLEERLSLDIITSISSGRADVGIVAVDGDYPHLTFKPYREDRLIVLVPRDGKFSDHASLTFAQCLSEPFICLQQGAALHTFLTNHAAAKNARIDVRVQVSGYRAIARLVSVGSGIGIAPESALESVDIGNLRMVKLDECWARRELRICYKHDPSRQLNPFQQHLIDTLCEKLQ